MAILKKIYRYPIKGLSGESLNETLLEKDQVLSGDREYAFARSHVSFDEKNPVYLRKTNFLALVKDCLLYTSPSPRDREKSRMPSSA